MVLRSFVGGCCALVALGWTVHIHATEPVESPFLQGQSPSALLQDSEDEKRAKEGINEEDASTVDEIVVTATRTEKAPFDIPASVLAVTAMDLRQRKLSRTLPEALSEIPGVMVQKTAHGQGSPFLRGFTGFRTLLLVDGIRMNNSVYRSGPNQYWSTVDPLTIGRLEVVKGPSSVLYGSDAVGGTVNAITHAPGPYGKGFRSSRRLYYRYASAENANVGRAEISASLGERFGLFLGGSFKDFGDLVGGRYVGHMPKTGYGELDGDVKVEWLATPDLRIVLAHQRVDMDDAWRTHKTIYSQPYAGTTVGNELRREYDQVRDLIYGRARWSDASGLWDAGSLTLSWQRHAEERDRRRTGGRRDIQGFEVSDLGLLARFESESDVGHWSWGLEGHREEVGSFRDDYTGGVHTGSAIQGPVADDATYSSLAAYLQDEIAGDSWSLIPGVRFTRVSMDAGRVYDPGTGGRTSVSDDWNALVGSLRGVWWLGPESNLYAGLSQGFRAPNLSDTTAFETTSVVELPTLGLEPESFLQLELGAKGGQDGWTWQGSVYRTWIADMIVRSPTGAADPGGTPIVRKDNVGDGWIHGVELDLRRSWTDRWSSGVLVSWMDGEVDQLKEPAAVVVRRPVDRLMPFQAVVDSRYQPAPAGWWVEGWAWLVDDQDSLALRDEADTSRIPPGGTPGFAVFGLSAGVPLDRNLDLGLTLENLGDKDYRVHGSGLNGPGRSLIVTLELRF